VTSAVFDANVLASGFLRVTLAAPALLIDAWRAGRFTLIVSEPLLVETERTLYKPYFADRLSIRQRNGIIALLRTGAVMTQLSVTVSGVATHPEDDLVLSSAVSAAADYLVTGDRKLQRLGSYEGVTIVSPRQFLDLLDEQKPGEPP
jgi:uncharacterized protein